jgi:lipopolysaccharide transport system permease protein
MVSAGMIAAVYGILFGKPFGPYFVFVAASLVSWTLIANVLSEAASLLWLSGTLMKTFRISPVSLLLANIWKNVIVLCHAILPALVGGLLIRNGDFLALVMFPVGLFLVVLNLSWMAFALSLLGARFRDTHDLVLTLMALAFLVTPVIWDASMLGSYRALAELNPLADLLDLLRRPILGEWPNLKSVIVAVFGAIVGWLLAYLVFAANRQRLALWVG